MQNDREYTIRTHEVIISITALVLFGVLFTATELFKSPFIVFAVILLVLYPFKKSKLIRIIIALSVIIFLLWFLLSISQLLMPFIIAFILSYILNPLVEKLNRKNIPRGIASILIILSLIAVIVLAIIFIMPAIVNQFTDFIKTLPTALIDIQSWITSVLIPWLASIGIPTQDLQNKIVNELPGRLEQIFNAVLGGLSGIFSGLTIILSQIINLILIPFLTFYLLKDFNNIKSLVKKLLPSDNKEKIILYARKIDELMGRYLRGALTVALINGVLVYILLSLIGVKYSIFLGAIAGLLDLIPYFGLLISLIFGTSVAIFSGDPSVQVPLTILAFIGLNILETSYLAPRIIGGKIGLHPALLILSLLVFSYFFGFVGLLIALPTVSIIVMFVNEWLDKKE
ncbi:MAG: AI-2E family transporter [Ignavibacteria bacterium]